MRDGRTVPGITPPAVVSQLAYRTFGPLWPDQVRTMLDYHGLTGRPAATRVDVAGRHGITPPTLTRWSKMLAEAGSRLPLTPSWPPGVSTVDELEALPVTTVVTDSARRFPAAVARRQASSSVHHAHACRSRTTTSWTKRA